jgi:protein-L-isoaspartate O-methyltransferase
VPELPLELARQLAPGGIAVMPAERAGRVVIVRMMKQPDGSFAEAVIAPASFAPLEPGIAREL